MKEMFKTIIIIIFVGFTIGNFLGFLMQYCKSREIGLYSKETKEKYIKLFCEIDRKFDKLIGVKND